MGITEPLLGIAKPAEGLIIMFYSAHVIVYIGFFKFSNFSSIFSIFLLPTSPAERRREAGEAAAL